MLNDRNQILVGQRASASAGAVIWQFPQGGIDSDESLETAALREACEELGLDVEKLKFISSLKAINQYDFEVPPEYAKNVWRGQRQNFAILKFLGQDSDFDLNRFEPEFTDWCWLKIEKLEEFVEPKRFKGYGEALIELKYFLEKNLL